MKIAWRRRRSTRRRHLRPGIGIQVASKEIRLAFHAVIAALNVNVIVILGPSRTRANRWNDLLLTIVGITLLRNFRPTLLLEIKDIHVIEPATAIKTAPQNELALVHHRNVAKASTGYNFAVGSAISVIIIGISISDRRNVSLLLLLGTRRGIARFLNARPTRRFNIKFPQVIQPRTAIVTAKQKYRGRISRNDDTIVFATAGTRLTLDLNLVPTTRGKIKRPKVVQSARAAAVAAKNKQLAACHDTGGTGSWRRNNAIHGVDA